MQMADIQQITGKNDAFIDCEKLDGCVHRDVIEPFIQLQNAAFNQGFELAIVSGYRSFDRQLRIWNAKATGQRPVFDDFGQVVDMKLLSPWQQVQSILRWSALPGASRHHWGTDLDVYDKAAVADDYCPTLSPEEVADNGPFGPMHCWLDQCIEQSSGFGFFRPYPCDNQGVAPERWHLSYAPLSAKFQSALTVDQLIGAIDNKSLILKEVVLEHIEEIYRRFVDIPPVLYPTKYRRDFSRNCDKISER
jgi:LAS superfamily LD-carboxypeptidase LdcB